MDALIDLWARVTFLGIVGSLIVGGIGFLYDLWKRR